MNDGFPSVQSLFRRVTGLFSLGVLLVPALVVAHQVHGQAGGFGLPGKQRPGSPPIAEELVEFTLIADTLRIEAGQSFHLIAVFKLEPKWHMYWANPGAGAAPPSLKLTLPSQIRQTGPMVWQRPRLLESTTGDQFVYDDEFAIFIPVQVDKDWTIGSSLMVSAEVRITICDDERCLIGSESSIHSLSRKTRSPLGPQALSEEIQKQIERLRARLPHLIGADPEADRRVKVEAKYDGPYVVIRMPSHGVTDKSQLAWFPGYTGGVEAGIESMEVDADMLTLRIRLDISKNNIVDKNPRVWGLIGLGLRDTDPSYEFSMPLPDELSE